MKRRSPWLTFAACAVLNGALAPKQSAPSVEKSDTMAIGKAAMAAEAELQKRGMAKDHAITSLALVQPKDASPYYLAKVEPVAPVRKLFAFQISMDGRVTEKSHFI